MNGLLAGKHVPRVGLGCMGMSEFYGETDDAQSLEVLMAAYEAGYRHFDTADMYGLGHNERLVSRFLERLGNRRDDILLASKVGIVRDQSDKYNISVNSSKDYLKKACESSLQRLKTEYIDLLYVHRLSADTPLEETMEAMSELVREGKIRHVGLCEVSAETLAAANAMHPIAALQSEYSLWTRDVEDRILPRCQELGIPLVAFSPLGRGFLTGTIDKVYMESVNLENDLRARLPRFSDDNIDKNRILFDGLSRISQGLDVKPSQLALGWLMRKGENVHLIPGTKRLAYLRENFDSLRISLSTDTVAELNRLFTSDSVFGERYPRQILSHSNG